MRKKKILLTKHAKDRFCQRMNVFGKKEMQSIATNAYYNGDTYVSCQDHQISRWLKERSCGYKYKVRLLNDFAFSFRNGKLITVIAIPDDLRQKDLETEDEINESRRYV